MRMNCTPARRLPAALALCWLAVPAAATESDVPPTGSMVTPAAGEADRIDAGAIPHAGSDACEPQWVPTFGGQPGVNGPVYAQAVFDDGSGEGPALYIGGNFSTAGGAAVNRIVKWDGTSWSPLGSGITGLSFVAVNAMAVFDDGSGGGPALYVGGSFTTAGGVTANRIAKWDGTSWSPLGSGMSGSVNALTVFDDGSGEGPALYAGGGFITAGGVTANRIAKWDGTSWSPLGTGVDGGVLALAVFDDGSGNGPALYAGGNFTTAGDERANRIATWNGTSWAPLKSGTNSTVRDLLVFDDRAGGGPALYVGGNFTTAGDETANRVARWDGAHWSPAGTGMDGRVSTLMGFDDGSGDGPALFAGGVFASADGETANNIAKWDGASWTPLGIGADGHVHALTVFDDGSADGPVLFAGGNFTTAGGEAAPRIARWNGSAWSSPGGGMSFEVYALAVFDDGSGSGPALFAGGDFVTTNATRSHIAKWDGTAWAPLGSGTGESGAHIGVRAMTVFDDGSGSGPALYVGGGFSTAGGVAANRIAKWDGTLWSHVGSGIQGVVHALTVFDDGSGPALYAGGSFTSAGGAAASRIARWDGTAWSPVGGGIIGPYPGVAALAVFDDGSGDGPALYAGGAFHTAGGVPASGIAKWDGTSWSPLGNGVSGQVNALTVFDNGSGPFLCAGGHFFLASGIAANHIAKWNGSSWSPVGFGMGGSTPSVFALSSFDDGSANSPVLFAGGVFTFAGGGPANRIAQSDGAFWSSAGPGMNGAVRALALFDDGSGSGPALYAGGQFTTSPAGDSFLAKWQGCPVARDLPGDLNGDGSIDLADLSILLNNWGPCAPPPAGCPADLNGDGVVDSADLLLLLDAWGGL